MFVVIHWEAMSLLSCSTSGTLAYKPYPMQREKPLYILYQTA